MAFLLLILNMAGTVALLLWGVRMVQTGIQRAFGPRLGAFLSTTLGNRLSAFLAGLGITAVLQSSTATGLMVSGLAARGMIALVPGLAVMLGANVGTTLIVQALSFNIAAVAPVLLLAGFVMFQRAGAGRVRDLGRAAIGLGLILLALHQLLDFITPLEAAPRLRSVLDFGLQVPLLALLAAAALTWAAHSSVAVVLLVATLAGKGLIHLDAAAVLVLGANLGTSINPVLESGTEGNPAARRLPVGNLMVRALGCGLGVAVLSLLSPPLSAFGADPARVVANLHTMFNVALALVFLPLLTPYARLMEWLFPPAAADADPDQPRYLPEAAAAPYPIAIGAAAREALHMVDVLDALLRRARAGFIPGDRHAPAAVHRIAVTQGRLCQAIHAFLAELERTEMTEADERRVEQLALFARNLEAAGTVIDRNLMRLATRIARGEIALPASEQREIGELMGRLAANLRTAAAAFMDDDSRAARLLAAEKEVFRGIEDRATEAWFERLRHRDTSAADASWLAAPWLDALRDLKQANAYLVAAAAYPVLKRNGELLPTRLAPEAEETC